MVGQPWLSYSSVRGKTSPKDERNRLKNERARNTGQLFVRGQKGTKETLRALRPSPTHYEQIKFQPGHHYLMG